MNTIDYVNRIVLPAAFGFLPAKMDSVAARSMLLCAGLQESRFVHRKQIGGPAHGFLQFEQGGGVYGVLNHPATSLLAKNAAESMGYKATPAEVYAAIVDNDILMMVFGRLLLWTLPASLPTGGNPDEGWRQYIAAWRPGKPHRATWGAFYVQAWLTANPPATA